MRPPAPQVVPTPYVPPAVAFVAVVRVCDQAVLARVNTKVASREELQGLDGALSQLLQRAQQLPAYPGWHSRQATSSDLEVASLDGGCVHALADPQALCLVAVGFRGQQYPERVAQELLRELVKKVCASTSEERLCEAKAGQLTSPLKGALREAIKSYSDPAKVDQVTQVQQKVDEVKGLMQDNVKKILETHVTLETLEAHSESMSVAADVFLKQSSWAKRQAQLRNLRLKCVAAVSVGAVALLLVLPLMHHWN